MFVELVHQWYSGWVPVVRGSHIVSYARFRFAFSDTRVIVREVGLL